MRKKSPDPLLWCGATRTATHRRHHGSLQPGTTSRPAALGLFLGIFRLTEDVRVSFIFVGHGVVGRFFAAGIAIDADGFHVELSGHVVFDIVRLGSDLGFPPSRRRGMLHF